MEKLKNLLELLNLKPETVEGYLAEEPTVTVQDLRNEAFTSMLDMGIQTGHDKIKAERQKANDHAYFKTTTNAIKSIKEGLNLEIEVPETIEAARDFDWTATLSTYKSDIDTKLRAKSTDNTQFVDEINGLKSKVSEKEQSIKDYEQKLAEANSKYDLRVKTESINRLKNKSLEKYAKSENITLTDANKKYINFIATNEEGVTFDATEDTLTFKSSDGSDLYINEQKPHSDADFWKLLFTKYPEIQPKGRSRTEPQKKGVVITDKTKPNYSAYEAALASAQLNGHLG